jgi:hypothetical protein
MKKILLFFLLLIATSCASTKTTVLTPDLPTSRDKLSPQGEGSRTTPPVYYTGNDEPITTSPPTPEGGEITNDSREAAGHE